MTGEDEAGGLEGEGGEMMQGVKKQKDGKRERRNPKQEWNVSQKECG